MKKTLLILAICLFGSLSANAATWVAIDSGNPDIQLFIDSDSIKYVTVDTCTYSLLYKKKNEVAKVVYVKSDYSKDKVGIIRVEEYAEGHYKPEYYSKHSKAYMKDVESSALLASSHNYALAAYSDKAPQYANEEVNISTLKNTSTLLATTDRFGLPEGEYNAYVDAIKDVIYSHWKTSTSTICTEVNMLISINADGSYNGYRLLESTDNDKAKRAAIAAVNLSAPFMPFPYNGNLTTTTINIPIRFEHTLLRKHVK